MHTADERGAGTEAEVSLTLQGPAPELAVGPVQLVAAGRASKLFERGATDKFTFAGPDILQVLRCDIGQSGRGGVGWKLDLVQVRLARSNVVAARHQASLGTLRSRPRVRITTDRRSKSRPFSPTATSTSPSRT